MNRKDELIAELDQLEGSIFQAAREEFNLRGFITDDELPFSRVIYNEVGRYMLEILSKQGFNGKLDFTGCYLAGYGSVYCIFDERLYDRSEALENLQNMQNNRYDYQIE